MFSIEHEFDKSVITILDDSGEHEDLIITSDDYGITIEQYTDINGMELVSYITLTEKMFAELVLSYNSPEGFFKTK